MSEALTIPAEYADRAATPEEINDALGEPDGPRPIVVRMDAQEIGTFTAMRFGPKDFEQAILLKLRDAGAPMEGDLNLKPAHGLVGKLKGDFSDTFFLYVWVPEAWVDRLRVMGVAL